MRCAVLGTATGRSSKSTGSKRTLHHVCFKEGSGWKMRVKIKPVNDMAVSDEHINIIILKKPKRRYRQIIKAYYRRMQKKEVKES
jgi:uncharacterized spore protein YtfJ